MKTLTFSRETIDTILSSKEVAIAGVSRNPKKFGNIVNKTLKEKGFKTFPINPNTDTIDGEPCYKSIAELPKDVKNLIILLKPKEVEAAVNQSIQKGISRIWLQQGSENTSAIENAKNAGVEMVTKKCILMYANPTGFHKFHARLNKLFGKY